MKNVNRNVVGLIFFFQHLDRLTIPIDDTFSNLRTGYGLLYGAISCLVRGENVSAYKE